MVKASSALEHSKTWKLLNIRIDESKHRTAVFLSLCSVLFFPLGLFDLYPFDAGSNSVFCWTGCFVCAGWIILASPDEKRLYYPRKLVFTKLALYLLNLALVAFYAYEIYFVWVHFPAGYGKPLASWQPTLSDHLTLLMMPYPAALYAILLFLSYFKREAHA